MVKSSEAQVTDCSKPSPVLHVGRIPIRNLWLLMLYASDLFRLNGARSVEAEENPDDLPDLVAELLTNAVAKRQRQQLSLGYRTREAALSRVRGKIDVLATERGQLLARGLIACRFEELTIDTPRNRFVRGALNSISGIVRRPALALRCKKLAGTLRDLGVSDILPTISQLTVTAAIARSCCFRMWDCAATRTSPLPISTTRP
jgi:5-methylcytosine-specific restriction enzyme subunit McrC